MPEAVDYLTFGLLAGSLIVIASFLLRDAAPHLSALPPSPPLGRLSRRGTPVAWRRWCADAGLVVSAAGTLVLLATVGALVADVADSVGTVIVALALTAALVGAALGLARLTVRLRHDVAEELVGVPPARRVGASELSAVHEAGLDGTRIAQASPGASPVDDLTDVPVGLWDDDLPTWSESSVTASPTVPPVATHRSEGLPPAPPNVALDDTDPADPPSQDTGIERHGPATPVLSAEAARRSRAVERARDALAVPAAVDPIGGEPAATVIGGAFSSPLLADIGLASTDEATDGFRSRLLLDLDRPMRQAYDEVETGSDVLLDESPVPTPPGARARDELT